MMSLQRSLLSSAILMCGLCFADRQQVCGASPGPLPQFSVVRAEVEASFGAQKNRQAKDLISRSEVELALREVKKLGWQIPDEGKILAAVLPDNHVLITTFRSPAGQRFMRQIAGRELMYDRMDRVSEVPGGMQLIRDIVKLPDGERFAKPRSGGGVPDLVDLLPKGSSGQTRRIRDYEKPTGKLYTVSDLLARLEASHRQATAGTSRPAARP